MNIFQHRDDSLSLIRSTPLLLGEGLHSKGDKIALLKGELKWLKALDSTDSRLLGPKDGELFARSISLLRKLNDIQPAIGVLPVEVLFTIFELACLPSDPSQSGFLDPRESRYLRPHFLTTELVLSAISHHWRKVAISLPTLWRTFRVYPRRGYCAKLSAELLGLYASRSALSMGVSVQSDEVPAHEDSEECVNQKTIPHPELPDVFLDEFEWAVFVEFPHAITSLSLLQCDSTRLSHLAVLLRPFTQMHKFRVQAWFLGEGTITQRGELANITEFRNSLGPQLTELDLKYLPYDFCAGLLRHCPNLVRCCCESPTCARLEFLDGQPPNPVDVKAYLSRLEWLEWEVEPFFEETLHFKDISSPALRGFKWRDIMVYNQPKHNAHITFGIPAAFTRFLSKATALTELELTLLDIHVSSLSQMFGATPRLEKLTLYGTKYQYTSTRTPLLGPLLMHTSHMPLPKLHTLVLKIHSTPRLRSHRRIREINVGADLLMIVRQRWMGRFVSHFLLSLSFSPGDWDGQVHEGFREMVEEGLQLKMTQFGRFWFSQ